MTPEEEAYFHLVLCANDLNESWGILNTIKEHRNHPLVSAAFRYALIAYARPYRRSRGSNKRQHILDGKFVPSAMRELHRRLVDDRDQVHAHSDLTVRDATLHVKQVQNGRWVGAVQRVIKGTEELENIDTIISLVEQSLDLLYEELRRRENALPFNSLT